MLELELMTSYKETIVPNHYTCWVLCFKGSSFHIGCSSFNIGCSVQGCIYIICHAESQIPKTLGPNVQIEMHDTMWHQIDQLYVLIF